MKVLPRYLRTLVVDGGGAEGGGRAGIIRDGAESVEC